MLLAGHTLALVASLLGVTSSLTYNVNPSNGNNEYGPMTVGFLFLTLALFALISEALLPEPSQAV